MYTTRKASWVLAVGLAFNLLLVSCGGGGGGGGGGESGVETLVVRDDFNELDEQVWAIAVDYGSVEVAEGVLQLDSLRNGYRGVRVSLEEHQDGGLLTTLTAISARVRIDELGDFGEFGLEVWEDTHVWFFEMHGSRVVEVGDSEFDLHPLPVEYGRWYSVRVELVGDTYNFFIDGQLVFSGELSGWHEDEEFVFLAYDALVSIDDFEAYGTLATEAVGTVILGVSFGGEPWFEFPDEPGGQSYDEEMSNVQYNSLGQVVSYDADVTFSDAGQYYHIEVRDIVRNTVGDTVSYTATVNGETYLYP